MELMVLQSNVKRRWLYSYNLGDTVHFRSYPEGKDTKVRAWEQVLGSWLHSGGAPPTTNWGQPRKHTPPPKPRRASWVWAKEKSGVQGAAEREAKAREGPRLRPEPRAERHEVSGWGRACTPAQTLTKPCRRRPLRCTRGWCSAAPRRTPARGPSPGPPPPPPCWLPSRRFGLDASRPPLGLCSASRRDRAATRAAAAAGDRERGMKTTQRAEVTASRATACLPAWRAGSEREEGGAGVEGRWGGVKGVLTDWLLATLGRSLESRRKQRAQAGALRLRGRPVTCVWRTRR